VIAKPVQVGLGHDSHLALLADVRADGRTYCGRWWTADMQPGLGISCRQCRAAYASGKHPALPKARA
jgi:hypothetical protein